MKLIFTPTDSIAHKAGKESNIALKAVDAFVLSVFTPLGLGYFEVNVSVPGDLQMVLRSTN